MPARVVLMLGGVDVLRVHRAPRSFAAAGALLRLVLSERGGHLWIARARALGTDVTTGHDLSPRVVSRYFVQPACQSRARRPPRSRAGAAAGPADRVDTPSAT